MLFEKAETLSNIWSSFRSRLCCISCTRALVVGRACRILLRTFMSFDSKEILKIQNMLLFSSGTYCIPACAQFASLFSMLLYVTVEIKTRQVRWDNTCSLANLKRCNKVVRVIGFVLHHFCVIAKQKRSKWRQTAIAGKVASWATVRTILHFYKDMLWGLYTSFRRNTWLCATIIVTSRNVKLLNIEQKVFDVNDFLFNGIQ